MGCEPRGFGWSATVEVCSARVTRLVTDLENFEKFSGTQLVPGTGRVDEICQHFDSGIAKVPGTGLGADLQASGHGRKGAWHRVGGLVC